MVSLAHPSMQVLSSVQRTNTFEMKMVLEAKVRYYFFPCSFISAFSQKLSGWN